MKTLKFTTYWTAEEADCICQLLDEFRLTILATYSEEIAAMYEDIREKQMKMKDSNSEDVEF